jgi:hypothetical protein
VTTLTFQLALMAAVQSLQIVVLLASHQLLKLRAQSHKIALMGKNPP